MAPEGAHNETGPGAPIGNWDPPQRTDTENAEYNSSHAPNSTTHSMDSYRSNSDRSPDEYRSESAIRDTGALFGQETPQRSTTLSSTCTVDNEDQNSSNNNDNSNNNMPTMTSGIPVPAGVPHRSDAVPQLRLSTDVLLDRSHGVNRRGSDIDDSLWGRVGQVSRSGASRLRNVPELDHGVVGPRATNASQRTTHWMVTESPTQVSDVAEDHDDLVSRGTAGPDDSDDEGKTKTKTKAAGNNDRH